MTHYLREHRRYFDLIVSADTLVYFGDLDPRHSRRGRAPCGPRGLLVFTLEHDVRGDEAAGYRLEFHGRYAHRRAYVEQILAAAGLRSQIVEADLRMESGAPVAGLVVRAKLES